MEVCELVRHLQLALSPDLLKKQWRTKAIGKHPTYGHCYVVTEAIYHLYGKSRGFKPKVVRVPEADNTTHWWLENAKGERIDGTKEQFESVGITIPYEQGRGSSFLTNKPSYRCNKLIARAGL